MCSLKLADFSRSPYLRVFQDPVTSSGIFFSDKPSAMGQVSAVIRAEAMPLFFEKNTFIVGLKHSSEFFKWFGSQDKLYRGGISSAMIELAPTAYMWRKASDLFYKLGLHVPDLISLKLVGVDEFHTDTTFRADWTTEQINLAKQTALEILDEMPQLRTLKVEARIGNKLDWCVEVIDQVERRHEGLPNKEINADEANEKLAAWELKLKNAREGAAAWEAQWRKKEKGKEANNEREERGGVKALMEVSASEEGEEQQEQEEGGKTGAKKPGNSADEGGKSSHPDFHKLEKQFLVQAHVQFKQNRRARHLKVDWLKLDWSMITETFNDKFEGQVLQGTSSPRPARNQLELRQEQARIEEICEMTRIKRKLWGGRVGVEGGD